MDTRTAKRGRRHQLWLQIAQALLPILVASAFVYFGVRYVGHVVTVRNVDYFQFVEIAQGLNFSSLRSWVNGMHPVGYPLLIRWGLAIGLDAVQIGHVLSIAGGVLLLLSAYLLAYHLTDSRWLALLTEGVLAATGYFLFFATLEGNDMLSAGLQALSLAVLVGLPARRETNLTAGLLAGLAYVMRYTAIVTSALCLLFLAGRAIVQRRRSYWAVAVLFLLGFLVGAAPQLIPSTLVTGNPFYTVRVRDLWWHVRGLSNFATQWHMAPTELSPVEIFLDDPARFIQHWWSTARSFWVEPDMLLLDTPLRLLTQAALLFTLLAGKKIDASKRILLALYVCGLLAALAFIRYDPRFLTPIMPVLAFCVVYFVWSIVPRHLPVAGRKLPVNSITLVALLCWSSVVPLNYLRNAPSSSKKVLTVTNTLRASGMRSASEVLSSAIPYHDASVPARTRYVQSYWATPDMDSLEELHAVARERGYRFVLYDSATGLAAHPGLEELLNPNSRPAGLTPLVIPENRKYALYRIEGDPPQPVHRLDAHLEGGITLMGYDVHVTRETPEQGVHRVGVFLYWQASQPVTKMVKVFVHVTDAAGQLAAQHDGVPALWTYSTDRWAVGEIVVDFHPVLLDTASLPGPYTVRVGLYTEDAGRVAVLDASGAPTGDFVTLQSLNIP